MHHVGTLDDIARERTDLDPLELERLHSLVGAWGLVADLALSDLVLWLPTWNSAGWIAAALVRPATAPTSVPEDIVGTFEPRGRRPELDRALATGVVTRPRMRTSVDGIEVPSGVEATPVMLGGRVVAAIARHPVTRVGGRLEKVYLEVADLLLGMVAAGQFPPPGFDDAAEGAPPRVGDGLICLTAEGLVAYASPNAVSAFRRLGLASSLDGSDLAKNVVRLWHRPGPVDEELALVAAGRIAGDAEVENAQASVSLLSVPLLDHGKSVGAIVLVRDITDLRRRERALLSKDATLREVHHRVKNNLQTVGALLRLQSRRVDAPEAKDALAEAGRRVSAIAAVHEILAQEPGDMIDFDDVMDRLVYLARDLAPAHARDRQVPTIARDGSVGMIPTDVAGPLAMAMSEVVHNAVEHAGASSITVCPSRTRDAILVNVRDDGCGIGDDVQPGLGMQIVRMLVEEDLRGSLSISTLEEGGTSVELHVPIAATRG